MGIALLSFFLIILVIAIDFAFGLLSIIYWKLFHPKLPINKKIVLLLAGLWTILGIVLNAAFEIIKL